MADADTIYRVLTVYDADASKGEASMGRFASVLDHVMHMAGEVKDVVGEMVSRIIEVGAAAEQAKISIAGLFSATGMTFGNDFNTALAMSTEMLAKMRKDAAALPGTFEDLTEIFQRAIPSGSNAGKSANQIEGLSAQMMAVGKAFGMNAEFIGREFSEMMEGRASSRVTLFAKMRQFMGPDMDSSKFNALAAPEKWERIEQALSKFNPMIKEYATTWDAVSTTAESYLTNVIRVGSAGVFDMLKQDLADLNSWYERNEETILKVARTLFDDLGGAIDFVIKMIQGSIETVVEWLQYFGLADDSADAVKVLVEAISGGITVLTAVIGLTTAWTVVQWGLNAALLANPIGLTVMAIGAMVGMIGVAIAYWEELTNTVSASFDIKPMRWMMKTIGVIPAGATDKDIDDAMGSGGMFGRSNVQRQKELMDKFGDNGFMAHVKDMVGMSNTAIAHGNMGNLANAGDLMGMMTGVNPNRAGMPDAKALLDRAGKPVTQHITNVGAVNLYTNIYDNEDPARVVDHLVNKIRGGLEHPSQSPSVPVYR